MEITANTTGTGTDDLVIEDLDRSAPETVAYSLCTIRTSKNAQRTESTR